MTTLTPNAQRLLRTLIAGGPAYRADLARTLDVSRATVTNLANSLAAEGLIEEPDREPSALKNLIGTAPELGTLVSVMFVVDSCAATLSTLDGRVLKTLTLRQSLKGDAAARMSAAADLVDALLSESGADPRTILALHLAVDTQMDARSGDVYAHRASSRWFGVNPKRYFGERFGVPVYVQNSARLEALAEYFWGAGAGSENMLHVEVSWGITSGHIVCGVIQSGIRGGSGELGHTIYDWNGPACTCGNTGCVMQYSAIPAMLRDYSTACGTEVEWDAFVASACAGDPEAATIVRRAARVLGRMLVNTCHMLDPERIVLSGEVARSLPEFVEQVEQVVRERALPLVGRNVSVAGATLEDVLTSVARAGIESLRARAEIVAGATRS